MQLRYSRKQITIQPPVVTDQIAADMFENKAKTRSVLFAHEHY